MDTGRARFARLSDLIGRELLTAPTFDARFGSRLRGRRGLALGMLMVLLWQGTILLSKPTLGDQHRRRDASGFSHHYAQKFFYFSHHLGLFPVATWSDWDPVDSAAGARQLADEHGDDLVNEWGYWSRLGENARIWAYAPHAWLSGDTLEPSLLTANVLLLNVTLLLLWWAFWRIERPVLGLLLVVLVGSSPTLLFHSYRDENIFAMQPCLALALLALHLKLLRTGARAHHVVLALVAGALIGLAGQIRAESLALVGCCLMAYLLLAPAGRWWLRVLLCLCVISTTAGSWLSIQGHFQAKRAEAVAFVKAQGGTPYEGFTQPTHGFWHPIFCGLGDFGEHLGYKWDDLTAYAYALPRLKAEYGLDVPYPNESFPDRARRKYLTELYHGPTKHYPKKLEDLSAYNRIIKDKVLTDLRAHPLWFGTVLLRRAFRVLYDTSRVHLRLAFVWLWLPFSGLMLLPFLFILRQQWQSLAGNAELAEARPELRFYAAITVFPLPLCANSMLIFSGASSTYNGCFHLVMLAIMGLWGLEWALLRRASHAVSTKAETA